VTAAVVVVVLAWPLLSSSRSSSSIRRAASLAHSPAAAYGFVTIGVRGSLPRPARLARYWTSKPYMHDQAIDVSGVMCCQCPQNTSWGCHWHPQSRYSPCNGYGELVQLYKIETKENISAIVTSPTPGQIRQSSHGDPNSLGSKSSCKSLLDYSSQTNSVFKKRLPEQILNTPRTADNCIYSG
jgi:hypothetical protein